MKITFLVCHLTGYYHICNCRMYTNRDILQEYPFGKKSLLKCSSSEKVVKTFGKYIRTTPVLIFSILSAQLRNSHFQIIFQWLIKLLLFLVRDLAVTSFNLSVVNYNLRGFL